MGFVVLMRVRMRCQGISKPSVQGRRLVQFPQHVEPVQSRATLNNRPQGSSVTCGLLPVSTPEAHKSPLAITPAGFFVPMKQSTMPFRARAELLVRRGEAEDFYEACSMLAKRRRKPEKRPLVTTTQSWLPYRDD